MPPADRLAAFVATAVVLVLIPGPSVLFVISRGVALGRRAALATVVGNGAGVFVQVVAVALGVGVVVERSVAVFTTVKLVGALYIGVLGVRAFLARRELSVVLAQGVEARPTRRILADGFVVGLTNPKTVIFFAAVLPQFVDRAAGGVPAQLLVLGALFVGIGLVTDSCYGLLAGTARDWLARSPRRLEVVGGAGGVAIVGLAVREARSGRRD